MNLYEYQAKEILRTHGLKVPRGQSTSDPEKAKAIADEMGGNVWAVKAQVKTGGRGKAGGIKIAKSLEEVSAFSKEILNLSLVTHQSGGVGSKVRSVLIEEGCSISKEFYLAITVDRLKSCAVCVASSEGGVEIEETARNNPSAIIKEHIHPLAGMSPYQARNIASRLGIKDQGLLNKIGRFVIGLYEVFAKYDCQLAEINPLVITDDGEVVALDAKLGIDDCALFRQADIAEMRDWHEESPGERIARECGLNYITLDGYIGCMVNGAGLAMATMDTVKLFGGSPANFLDVGGGASTEMVTKAFSILMSDDNVRSILVNIFGGILQCDVLAEGVVAACREVKPQVPLVVRLEGTNVEEGRRILDSSGLNIVSEQTMEAAAQRAVELAKESD